MPGPTVAFPNGPSRPPARSSRTTDPTSASPGAGPSPATGGGVLRAGPRRMRVLFPLASTNQMYSGVGRALREFTARLGDRVRYEFAIDDLVPKNVEILQAFCAEHDLPFHVGPARRVAEFSDPLNLALPALLRERRWDAIEVVGWANAGTHDAVLEGLGEAMLCYTPHYQPNWTIPLTKTQSRNIKRVHRRVLRRAEVVFCDSPWERQALQARVRDRDNCVFLTLGCDFGAFGPSSWHRKFQLLFVGDLAEPRKRFDRVLEVFIRLHRRWPALRLVVVGNRSDQVLDQLPEEIRPACELRGYVSESELRAAYAESRGLLLLSDFEAFGLPNLEALASGTPIFLSRQEATLSLFGRFRGAHFCPSEDIEATVAVIAGNLERGTDAVAEVIDERERLRAAFDWEGLALQKWQTLASAWFERETYARSA